MDKNKVWLVTGASKGIGLALVKKLLADGYKVAATSRDVKTLSDAVDTNSSTFLPLHVDLANDESVLKAIALVIKNFGKIDIVVNNAGYGQLGTLEELSDSEARENFDINIFGMLNVIRHSMPHFRQNVSGHFINISSIAGFLGGFAGWGIYNATKFAVAGLSEALAVEAKSLGIKTTIVYPGYFRTNFLMQDSLRLAKNPISAYKEARDLEVWHETQAKGNQPGDPEKLADVLIAVAENENPPLHLFLGTDSITMAKTKIESLQNEIKTNETLSMSTDF